MSRTRFLATAALPRLRLPAFRSSSRPPRAALLLPVAVVAVVVVLAALTISGDSFVGGTAASRTTAAVPATSTSTLTPSSASSSSAAGSPAPLPAAPAASDPPAPVAPPAVVKPIAAGPPPCGRFFDDFRYSSSRDGRLTAAGWTVRTDPGGPGPGGARWSADAVTFPAVDGESVAQLAASTDGTAAGTTQAELFQGARRFREGTYASRVRFADGPTTGADGDHLMQAYTTLSPMNGDYDPLYSQLSLTEYTPNGAWGSPGPMRSHASVYTVRPDPYDAKQAVTTMTSSANGWHTVVAQVGGGHVRYYFDGALVADHTSDGEGHSVLPRQGMGLYYNTWFVDLNGHQGGRSTYVQQVDWTYYAQDASIAPGDAVGQVTGLRSGGVERLDTLRGSTAPCG
ncbi:glycoside hydrolase family 16 protein [Actinosynnema sp. CA-299493]